MRLFLSTVPPPAQRAEVASALGALPVELREARGLRWLDPVRWHITLAFLGDVQAAAVPRLVAALAAAAERSAPPGAAAIAGAGTFGPRALWLGVTDSAGAPPATLAEAVASLRRACAQARVPCDRKPWRPHLSVARARGDADVREVRAALAYFEGTPWDVRGFALVRSVLGPAPVHIDLATFTFGLGHANGPRTGDSDMPTAPPQTQASPSPLHQS